MKRRFLFDWLLIGAVLLFVLGPPVGVSTAREHFGLSYAEAWYWNHGPVEKLMEFGGVLAVTAVVRFLLLLLLKQPADNRPPLVLHLSYGALTLGTGYCFLLLALLSDSHGNSPVNMASGDIGALNSALALYQVDVQCKQFPATTLMQLYSDNAAGWAGPYMATITPDPWNSAYTYSSDGISYTIQSVHDSPYNRSETLRYCSATGMMESIP